MAITTNSLNITNSGVVSFNSATGLFSESALTQFDILVGGASNAIGSISPSTAGLVLTSNGVSASPTFQAIPGVTTSTTLVTSTPYTVLSTDDIILVDTVTIGGVSSIVLPAAPIQDGQVWTIKDWSGQANLHIVTISVSGGANIDASPTFLLNESYQSVSIAWSLANATYSIVYDYQTVPGGIVTINGDTGSITGSTVTIYANNATQNSGSSVLFSNTGTTSTLNVTDGNQNTLIGLSAGNATVTGNSSTGLGNLALNALSSGTQDTMIGAQSGQLITTASDCVGVGFNSLGANTTAGAHTAIGSGAMAAVNGGANCVAIGNGSMGSAVSPSTSVAVGTQSLQTTSGTDQMNVGIGHIALNLVNGGSFNTSAGGASGDRITTGSYNCMYGYHSGHSYTSSESSNILLNSAGSIADANTLRIGAGTGTGNQQLNKSFVHGINGVTVSNTQLVTIDSTTSQLGTIAVPAQNLTWTDEAISFAAAVNNGYYTTAALTATLPSTPSQGQVIEILAVNAAAVTIQAAAGQAIHFGSSASTVAGTATSTARGDSVKLIYRPTGNIWWAFTSSGSWILA